jgi:hypothetical protein
VADLAEAQADLKAEQKITQAREQMKSESKQKDWDNRVASAEKEHAAVRDTLWQQDVARVATLKNPTLDLRNQRSPLYIGVQKVLNAWKADGDPICEVPEAYRIAVEQVCARFRIPLPPVVAEPKPAAQVPSVQPKNQTVQRKNSQVVAGSNPPGMASAMTQADAINKLRTMKPADRARVLEQLENQGQSRRNTW